MFVEKIENSVANVMQLGGTTMQNRVPETAVFPPAPASAVAVPAETARAQVNAALMVPAQSAPMWGGIYIIESKAMKTSSVSKLAQTSSGSSWGF